MQNFEVYVRGASRRDGRPTVTITPSPGRVAFSAAAYEALGRPPAVVCLTNRGERLIGFRPAGPEEPNAYRIHAASRTASVVALLRYMDIDLPSALRWPLLTDDGTPHIDLKQPGTPVTSNRRKK